VDKNGNAILLESFNDRLPLPAAGRPKRGR